MSTINESIENRKPYTGFDDNTYYTQALFDFVVDNFQDPDVLFKLKILGKYRKTYRWTEQQAWDFINANLESSRGHDVNGTWYAYDWGSGENRVTKDKMHEPNLDHIIPREQGGSDDPENMRIRCRRLNENKGNTNTDQERWATIVDMWNDIEDKEQYLDQYLSLIHGYIIEKKD